MVGSGAGSGSLKALAALQNDSRFKNRYDVAAEAMRLVAEGKKPFISQYLLNPSAGVHDVYLTFLLFALIVIVRYTLAGAQGSKFKGIFVKIWGKFAKAKREHKFAENAWYTSWHTISFCLGVYVLYCEGLTAEEPGWTRMMVREWDTTWYWFPTPTEQTKLNNPGWPLFPVSNLMRTFYLAEMAFWCSCILFLWFETVRDDFNALMLHHMVTVTLIGFSYLCTFWRIGIVIQLTHDLADIVLYGAKALHYTSSSPFIVDSLFVLFVFVFFVSRLLFFPLFCLWPTLDPGGMETWIGLDNASPWHIPGGVVLPGFLCILQMLHVFWFGLILKMVKRSFKGKKASQEGDIRSDQEAEEEEEEEEIKETTSVAKGVGAAKNQDAEGESSGMETTLISDQLKHISSLPGVRATATDTATSKRAPVGRRRRKSSVQK